MRAFLLVFTALSVSLDSFFCGFSLSANRNKNFITLLGISGTVFLLCLFASTLGTRFGAFFNSGANVIGGAVLIMVASCGFISDKSENTLIKNNEKHQLAQAIIIGFSIGLDGALGCFSLTISGMNSLLVCLYITAFHLLLLELSFIVANNVKRMVERFRFLPSLTLFALGYFKLLTSI